MGAIVLFDGVCNFCDRSVNFVIEHDPKGYFKFAPLQSEMGAELAQRFGVTASADNDSAEGLVPIDSVMLIEDEKLYTHSTAALKIARRLSGAASILYAFIIVPQPVRDYFYKLFARNRYKFFGRKDVCMMPTPEVRSRFLG